MARKESISKQMILDVAFEMAREEGLANVTARRVAERANCSTQPIFRSFASMEELTDGVYARAISYFQEYYLQFPRQEKMPFCDLGMAYLAFAREEKELFRMLFVSDKPRKPLYEILNGPSENVKAEIQSAAAGGCKDPGGLFMKMWIFIHGAACMSMTGDYDLTDQETRKMLDNICKSFLVNP